MAGLLKCGSLSFLFFSFSGNPYPFDFPLAFMWAICNKKWKCCSSFLVAFWIQFDDIFVLSGHNQFNSKLQKVLCCSIFSAYLKHFCFVVEKLQTWCTLNIKEMLFDSASEVNRWQYFIYMTLPFFTLRSFSRRMIILWKIVTTL